MIFIRIVLNVKSNNQLYQHRFIQVGISDISQRHQNELRGNTKLLRRTFFQSSCYAVCFTGIKLTAAVEISLSNRSFVPWLLCVIIQHRCCLKARQMTLQYMNYWGVNSVEVEVLSVEELWRVSLFLWPPWLFINILVNKYIFVISTWTVLQLCAFYSKIHTCVLKHTCAVKANVCIMYLKLLFKCKKTPHLLSACCKDCSYLPELWRNISCMRNLFLSSSSSYSCILPSNHMLS